MPQLIAWPPEPPTDFGDLYVRVTDLLGATLVSPASMDDVGKEPGAALVIVSTEEGLRALEAGAEREHLDIVAVVSDGYLGSDGPGREPAMFGGAAVSLVRSLAVRRGGESRANVVCVPESLFGEPGTPRGPLRHAVTSEDVAQAVAFFLDESGGYLNGQVLFVDGGRHVFSSMSA